MPALFNDPALRKKQVEFYNAFVGLAPRGIRHRSPHAPYFSGYEYETLYDWDQYFEGILLSYCGFPLDYLRNGIRLFLSLQKDDGYVPRSFHPSGGVYYKHDTMFKPFLAQMVLLIMHQDNDLDWLMRDNLFQKLKKYYCCWIEKFDVRGGGLSVWHDAGHTGMDNHYDRAGDWTGENHFCEGVDLNSYLVREGEALALLAKRLKLDGDAVEIRQLVQNRKQAMQRWLWNEREGFFFDYHAQQNREISVKYAGAFAVLWAGAATSEQADAIVKRHLLNDREFWRPFPVPSLAATEPGYSEGYFPGENLNCCNWRANTWIPINYLIFHGLRRYGYHDIAAELAKKTFDLFDRGRFCEYYTSESGIGTGLKPFWGWSSLAVFMPAEYDLHIDPTLLNEDNDAVSRWRSHWKQIS